MWPLWKVLWPPLQQPMWKGHQVSERVTTHMATAAGVSQDWRHLLAVLQRFPHLCAVVASSCSQVLFSLFSRSRIEKHETGWFCKHTSSLAIVWSSLEPKKANRWAGFRSQYRSHPSPSRAPANTCLFLHVTQTDPHLWQSDPASITASNHVWPAFSHLSHSVSYPFPCPSLAFSYQHRRVLASVASGSDPDRVPATQDILLKLCLCRNSEAHLWQVQARRMSTCFLAGSMPENPSCGSLRAWSPCLRWVEFQPWETHLC